MNGKMYTIIRRGENVTSVEEYDIVWDETDGATNPILVGTMVYSFDGKGKQFRKKYVPADGSDEQKYVYEFKDEQNVAVQLLVFIGGIYEIVFRESTPFRTFFQLNSWNPK